SNVTINLLHFGIADNTTNTPITSYLNVTSSATGNSSLDLVLELPHFRDSFSYDPDFSITLTGGSASGTGGGDGGSSTPLLPLLALIALILPLAFVLVATATAITACLVWRARKHPESVQF